MAQHTVPPPSAAGDPRAAAPDRDISFYQPADTFFPSVLPDALTYDDLSLATRFSEVLPRHTQLEVWLSDRLDLHIPIVSADMDTVTEARMAIQMALNGGLGLIHYNMPLKQQVKEVARVKNHIHGFIQDPVTVLPDDDIGDVLQLIEDKGYKFSTFPVVDDQGKLLGLVPGRVVKGRYANRKVSEAMFTRDQVFTLTEKDIEENPIAAADAFFNEHLGIHKLLVVDDDEKLKGLFTLSDIERINAEARLSVKPARDLKFRLRCGAALSILRQADGSLDREGIISHVGALVDEGVDAVAVSTAHGHTAGVGDTVRIVRDAFPDLTIIAGNITSGAGVDFLADCGANTIKVGQGPGSICTTRIVAGVGIPQMTALYVAGRAAAEKGVTILADGGITKSGDIVKALTLADGVICGGLLAGCREAPGQIMEINGKLYKQYRGMGSLTAMREGSAARYGHDKKDVTQKAAAEGIEALKEVSGSLDAVLRDLVGGLQSGMGYLGAASLKELKAKARYIRVSPAGQKESAPHDVITVKTSDAPNNEK
ncbi:MAG: IMP dehydrogenase [Opitutales bacterium]